VSRDDPFFNPEDSDRTVIRPMPGGRRMGRAPPQDTPPPQRPRPGDATPPASLPSLGSSVNPLVRCASSLLVVAGQLRNSVSHSDPEGLRQQLVNKVREFESCARSEGIPDATVLPARYLLCSLLDEAVLGTPWGSESVWANQGLLITFHKEAWGGEKFFQALERLIAYPSGNLHMLELAYLCLAFGFEGRYRVREGGKSQLEGVREQLFQTIRAQRGDPERELSPHWAGVVGKRDPLIHAIPLWVLSSVAAALLLAMFAAFNVSLHRDSEPVFQRVANINVPTVMVARAPPPIPRVEVVAPAVTLRMLLKEEIGAGKLEVVDRRDGETIRIRGDGLFASGKVSVKDSYLPILARIGTALDQLPGRIVIVGHTDSVPIRSRRFASNQQLSEERAQSVRKALEAQIRQTERIDTKGMGAADLLIEDSPTDARNRRVEITLVHGSTLGNELE
jgi:type VI secretion system protein ImpK